ncbi:MAG: AIPR family protein [Paludibacteraceae bacterium]|nr:AIPR family protein [Paludibacteraceae bacterium]
MATHNDFKRLNLKCQKYFELAKIEGAIPNNVILDDENQKRFGFYYLVLQNVLEIDDFSSITDCITDQDFNAKIFNNAHQDEGIDAVYIDDDNKLINLFNFKYRPKWNIDREQSINETIISSKYLNIIQSENNSLDGKLKEITDFILEKNKSNEAWDTVLYIVSNENKELDESNQELKNLNQVYGIETKCIGLDTLVQLMSLHPAPVSTKIIVPAGAILTYSEDNISTEKSYVLCVRLTDLIRITCDDENLRNNTSLEDESTLFNTDIEMNVLYENVRGFILKSKYNSNILETLKNEPSRFYFYNNGLTIVAKDINVERINSNKKWKLNIEDFQVINGGQTLRTIHKYAKEERDNISKLSDACVQLRIIKVNDEDLKSKISEYTNSQNAISVIDLKSMRKEQIDLEDYLSENEILYIRKSGNTGKEDKKYSYCITLQKLGQILYAVYGNPGQVSNKKKNIFTIEYDNLFCTDELLSSKTVDYIKTYYDIKNKYKPLNGYFELKVFFILYLSVKLSRKDYGNLIKEFDNFISSTIKPNLKASRRLIQPSFIEEVNSHFGIVQ